MAKSATLFCVLAALALVEHARGHQATCADLEGGGGPADFCALDPVATLYQRQPAWEDYSTLLAAVRVGQRTPTAAAWLPDPWAPAASRLLALGDAAGGLHLLTPEGIVAAQHHSGAPAAVTALAAYRLRRNATVLVSGHDSGELRMHLLTLRPPPSAAGRAKRGQPAVDDTDNGSDAAGGLASVELLAAFAPQQLLCGHGAAAPDGNAGSAKGSESSRGGSKGSGGDGACAPITALHGAARSDGQSVVAVVDAAGGLAVLGQRGGHKQPELLLRTASPQPVLAARATLAGVALVGTWGTAWLPLPRKHHPPAQGQAEPSGSEPAPAPDPLAARPPRFSGCRGLEQVGGSLAAVAFDPVYGTRAHGLTLEGRLALLSLAARRGRPEDACRLRSASRPLRGGGQGLGRGQAALAEGGRAALAGLPGYALVGGGGQLALLNVTEAMNAPPRLLLRQPLANLSRQLAALLPPGAELQQQQQQQVAGGWRQRRAIDRDATSAAAAAAASGEAGDGLTTLLATDRQGRVAIGLGGSGVVAIFSTGLPFGRAPAPGSSRTVGWFRGVLQLAAVAGAVGMAMWKARAMPGGGGGGAGGGFGRRRGRGASELDKLQHLEALLRDPLLAREPKWGRRRRAAAAAAAAAEEDEPEDSAGGRAGELEPGAGGVAAAAAAAARRLAQPAPAASSAAAGGEAGGRGEAVHELAAAAAALERGRRRAQNRPDRSGIQEGDSELALLGSRQNSGFGSDIDD